MGTSVSSYLQQTFSSHTSHTACIAVLPNFSLAKIRASLPTTGPAARGSGAVSSSPWLDVCEAAVRREMGSRGEGGIRAGEATVISGAAGPRAMMQMWRPGRATRSPAGLDSLLSPSCFLKRKALERRKRKRRFRERI